MVTLPWWQASTDCFGISDCIAGMNRCSITLPMDLSAYDQEPKAYELVTVPAEGFLVSRRTQKCF